MKKKADAVVLIDLYGDGKDIVAVRPHKRLRTILNAFNRHDKKYAEAMGKGLPAKYISLSTFLKQHGVEQVQHKHIVL